MLVPRLSILYDGGCAFCVRAVRWLRGADLLGAFRFIDAQDHSRVTAQFPQVRPQDTAEAMICVLASGQTLKGFHAFRYLIWFSPWLLPLVVLFYFPGAGLVGPSVYAWVARNRRRLGCGPERCQHTPPDR